MNWDLYSDALSLWEIFISFFLFLSFFSSFFPSPLLASSFPRIFLYKKEKKNYKKRIFSSKWHITVSSLWNTLWCYFLFESDGLIQNSINWTKDILKESKFNTWVKCMNTHTHTHTEILKWTFNIVSKIIITKMKIVTIFNYLLSC